MQQQFSIVAASPPLSLSLFKLHNQDFSLKLDLEV